MATLSSPGVSVTVIDESFYTPAAPGTVPLIIVASQANKQNSAGTGIAPGTAPVNAGKVYLLTSQMDLGNTFGIPYFETDESGNPVNAGEINEYGLQAAYSFLGVSNRAYVVRADVDTKQLIGTPLAPTGLPTDGAVWFDTTDTNFGVFEWNANPATSGGQVFNHQSVTVITDSTLVNQNTYAPLPSIGAMGTYALVAVTTLNKLWYKKPQTSTAAAWVEVGSSQWIASRPTVSGGYGTYAISGETLIINGTTVTNGGTSQTSMASAINNASISGVTAAAINGQLQIYSTGVAVTITGGTGLNDSGLIPSYVTVTSPVSYVFNAPSLTLGPHYSIPSYGNPNPAVIAGYPTGSIWVKTTPVNQGAAWLVKQYSSATNTWITQPVNLYSSNYAALAAMDPTGGGINLVADQIYVKYNDDEATPPYATFKIYYRSGIGSTVITSAPLGAASNTIFTNGTTYTFTISETVAGSATLTSPVTVSFTGQSTGTATANALLTALQSALLNTSISASLNSNGTIDIAHTQGGDMVFTDGTHTPLALMFALGTTSNWYSPAPVVDGDTSQGTTYIASLWNSVVGEGASQTAYAIPAATPPTTVPENGRLWYNSDLVDVDIMINNGTHWVGYLDSTAREINQAVYPVGHGIATDPNGPIVSASKPTSQSDGTLLANGDLWIDPSPTEDYPQIYRYNSLTAKWILLDNTDQTTANGVVFADARWNIDGGVSTGGKESLISDLLQSNFIDFDAPDAALYPKGMLLWNLRRSGFNVKKYVQNYVDVTEPNTRYQGATNAFPGGEPMAQYFPDRWVSAAPNDTQGVGQFGRKAQRAVVLNALTETIQSNQGIRQPDTVIFNLLSCPGYLETVSSLVSLNTDNGETAFIVADTPARLTPDATTLSNWGNNTAGAAIDGEKGLIENYAYSAVYYPWAYTQDLTGNNIVVPPSHIMLRTIALSDNVSYPWFAPAGVRRGGVTNASSVGYVDGVTGEYVTVALNTGQRDTLASVHVNPITYLAGTGLVCYGQKTRQLVASSLDRINVARLVIFMRYQLNLIAKPFVFEPNDTITRNEIKQQVEKFLLELVGQRALYDYLVVCDNSNNTPARIDRNELYVDIAIEPVKAVEFIYIPLRLENTGAVKGLG